MWGCPPSGKKNEINKRIENKKKTTIINYREKYEKYFPEE
jgi:hypothetical protein